MMLLIALVVDLRRNIKLVRVRPYCNKVDIDVLKENFLFRRNNIGLDLCSTR